MRSIVFALACLVVALAARGQCGESAPTAELGGAFNACDAITSSRFAVGNGHSLQVIDLAAGGAPSVRFTRALPRQARQIHVRNGDQAWVADWKAIHLYDGLSAVVNPGVWRSTFEVIDADLLDGFNVIVGMVVQHPRVMVVTQELGAPNPVNLRVLDYSNPASPVEVGSLVVPGAFLVDDISSRNDRVYVLADGYELSIIDVSNPAAPAHLRTFILPRPGDTSFRAVYATTPPGGVGTRFYLAEAFPTIVETKMWIYDLPSEGGAMVRLPISANLDGIAESIVSTFVGATGGHIYRLNVTEGVGFSVANRYDLPIGRVRDLGALTNMPFVAAGEGGFHRFDTNLNLTGTYQNPIHVAYEAAFGASSGGTTYAYVDELGRGASIVGVSGPTLSVVGGNPFPPDSAGITCDGVFAYTAGTGGAVHCWDVSVPASPVLRATHIEPNSSTGTVTALPGNRATFTSTVNGQTSSSLNLIDFTPNPPVVRHRLPVSGLVRRHVFHDGLLYRLTWDSLSAYAIVGDQLVLRSTIALPGTRELRDVAFGGRYAYVARGTTVIEIIDYVNPAAPAWRATFSFPYPGAEPFPSCPQTAIAVQDGWLLYSCFDLQFFDLSRPTAPARRAAHEAPCVGPLRIASSSIAGQPAFLAAFGDCGVHLLHPPPDYPPIIVQRPIDVDGCVGGNATFSVIARPDGSPTNPLTYQWQRYRNSQAQNIPGATNSTFTLTNIAPADADWGYRVVVSNLCGNTRSEPAELRACAADFDDGSASGLCDGGVTIDDLLFYLFLFELGDPRADLDDGNATGLRDGGVTIDDLLFYLTRFELGC